MSTESRILDYGRPRATADEFSRVRRVQPRRCELPPRTTRAPSITMTRSGTWTALDARPQQYLGAH
jgi:hypothetical protein